MYGVRAQSYFKENSVPMQKVSLFQMGENSRGIQLMLMPRSTRVRVVMAQIFRHIPRLSTAFACEISYYAPHKADPGDLAFMIASDLKPDLGHQ